MSSNQKATDNKNIQAFLGLIRDTEGTAKVADPYRVLWRQYLKNQIKDLPSQTSNAGDLCQTDWVRKHPVSKGVSVLELLGMAQAKQHGLTDFLATFTRPRCDCVT